MDGDGEMIAAIQSPPGPPAAHTPRWSRTTSRPGQTLQRLLDVGIDQFFGTANDLVVPSEGGWRVGRSAVARSCLRRFGCFGPGGNLPAIQSRTSTSFRSATAEFLVNALLGRPHNR